MTKISFTIETATFDVSRGFRDSDDIATTSVDVTKLPESIIARLFEYGLTQKIADKASGAKNKAEAQAMLDEAVSQLVNGDWRVRASGVTLDPMQPWRRRAVRQLAKSNDALKDKIASYDAGADRTAFIDHIAAENAAIVDPIATELFEADKAARAKAKAATELTL